MTFSGLYKKGKYNMVFYSLQNDFLSESRPKSHARFPISLNSVITKTY